MRASRDVIIVGGGAVGAACARELALAGHKVLILEPGGDLGQAWRAAAGMLAPQIEADGSDPLLEFGLAAREHYPGLAEALRETTGIDVGLWRGGIARVATDSADGASLQAKVKWQRLRGYPCEWLDAEDLRHRWPWLGPALGALWAPRDGSVDPIRLVHGLHADARRLGARTIQTRVHGIVEHGSSVAAVVADDGRHLAADIVIAAGAWSGLIGGLPHPLPVEPVRGQMAALPWPRESERAIVYHRDSYLLARADEVIVGSTMEHAGYHPEVTSAGLAQILSATMTLCPALVRAKVLRSWAGLRPVTPDGLPIIGAEPELKGLWYATGHGRNGILLAGLTGRLIAQLIGGEEPALALQRFRPDRFRGGK